MYRGLSLNDHSPGCFSKFNHLVAFKCWISSLTHSSASDIVSRLHGSEYASLSDGLDFSSTVILEPLLLRLRISLSYRRIRTACDKLLGTVATAESLLLK